QFRREWLTELARREDWAGFIAFDRADAGASTTLRCLRLQARIATDAADAGIRDEMLAVWPTGQSLPDACDAPIAHARSRGWIDGEATWARLRLAVEAGNAGVATHLARQLPAADRTDGERLAKATSDPEGSLKAAA